jgi:pimeloyl-ACP methyl ester carboxylesterase
MEPMPGEVVPAKGSRFLRIAKKGLLWLLVLVVIVAVAGASYQTIATWRDTRRFPQPGRSVALGSEFPGVKLNLDCTGQGSPTVILDSGLGVPAAGWALVQPEVAKFSRVCSYDRAGYGWSSAGPMPRTTSQIVKELHALLVASGEQEPYVLAAHSFGGYNVRVYTSQYPAEVAGLVLVDTSHEDQEKMMPPSLQKFMEESKAQLENQRKLAPLMIFFGIARIAADDDGLATLSKELRDEAKYLQLQTKFIDAAASEMQHFSESAAEVRRAGNLGDRPLVVLTAGKAMDSKELPKGVSPQEMQDFQKKTWMEDLQVREARLSTKGRQIVVPDSTHMIPFERPDTVIAAIREVCQAVRAGATPKP